MSDTRSSWSERLAARWGRAESTVTKLFLATVFAVNLLAQFVKPLGDALQDKVYLGGALFTLVGYVLYAEVQRLNAALQPRAGEAVTPRDLEREFEDALESGGEVRLTAMGFTGETFATPLKTILQRLSKDPRRKVRLRVLVPDFTKEIEVPGQMGTDGKVSDAPNFREHLRGQIADYERSLKSQIGRMADARRGVLTVEFRVLHMSPSLKLYFINDDVVYEGIYDKLDLRRPDSSNTTPETPEGRLLDLMGYDSLLTRWSVNGGSHARTIIERRRELFETLWNAAHELTPVTRLPAQPSTS
ncbi:ATP/GTP-binding protein [Streptomyces coacervatus]|uniref:ATP/GTP-binding protein n=1 Tax=Streptomyces coacervatus TaxID=647381 RepID=UPI0023DBC63A|nr:ATP/GTP-binding protein [Streptomyces coacervatus]MDF2271209.1 ATP/GTP-binding protein [Streptomyces coacervatus]